MRWVVVLKG